MVRIDEIESDVFRLSIFSTESGFQYNAFLVRDEDPLLTIQVLNRFFSLFSQAAASLIDLKQLRWISYSHFEADECGALNEWLTIAPQAEAVIGMVGAAVNGEFAIRPILYVRSRTTRYSVRERKAFVICAHLIFRMDGMQECFLKSLTGHFLLLICFIKMEMWNPSLRLV